MANQSRPPSQAFFYLQKAMYPQFEQDNYPNLFAVIPAKVRYDKNLSSTAKLIFAEVSALSNKEGYCWANNAYFADLYGCTKDTISRVIAELEKFDYITVIIDKAAGNKRRIYARFDHYSAPKQVPTIRKNPKNLSVKKPQGHTKKTDNNNITNNTSKIRERRLSEKPKSNFSDQPDNDTVNPMLSSPTWDQVIFAGAKLMPVEPLPSENPFDERERPATYYENSQYVIQQGEKYTTDSDLVAVMANYYRSNPQEYKVGILQDAKGARFTPEQIKDFTVMWAAHAIANNKYNRTAHQLHMDLKRWILRESQYSAKSMKQAGGAAAPVIKKKTIDFI
jgi:menaquinone-dependent protoporphyrinogen IX oxidase